MTENESQILLYCDGASRGNPGPAAVGAAVAVCGSALLFL